MRVPSGLYAAAYTSLVCPLRVRSSAPVFASHTFAALSSLPVTIRVPLGLNATAVTLPVCPLRMSNSAPVLASRTFAVLSQLPATMRVPSGLCATLVTSLVPTLSVSSSAPVFASHTTAVLHLRNAFLVPGLKKPFARSRKSEEVMTMRVPSWLNVAVSTLPVCPLRVSSSVPLFASHTFAVRSSLLVTTRVPSGLNPITSIVRPLSANTSAPIFASQSFTSPGP